MAKKQAQPTLENDPLWFKDAIIYQLHVRAFHDANDDGIGDFRGLAQKIDYLADLGVTAIWLLPFYPSPLRDDGYDIADYSSVNPSYGEISDIKAFIKEAHRRGLRVITELVCNHTSDQHAWFQAARRAKPGTAARDFYVWSDTPEKYNEVRIIFKDFETSNWAWDNVANAYYWHRFFHHQPDLNFDNPAVHRAILKAMDFWLDMGVDGLRLDAIPYLYEREGTSSENLPETHGFLKKLRTHVDKNHINKMLLAEANQWPEDAVEYFGDGDECHMSFHFPLMPRMFMALHMEDRYPIIDILDQTPAIPENAQWALFLRNHDELTLEMVTDEERDYMYRVYANDPQMRINLGIRRRLAPLLGNNRRRIELMNGLLFSLPGTPVIYYGDEIGMGDNIYLGDRNGVRTPMQWSPDRNAGFSQANRQKLYLPVIVDPEYHYEAINVASQQSNPHSLLWWMKRLIALRKRYRAFGRGTLEFLFPENRKVLAYVRRAENETILVVANLSRFVQASEIDLSQFRGMRPVEMFGRVEFPAIGELPYFLTLGPHAFYWFSLEAVPGEPGEPGEPSELPVLELAGGWEKLTGERGRAALAGKLAAYLQARRWYGGKARTIKGIAIKETLPLPFDGSTAQIALVEVSYTEGEGQVYLLPLAFATGEAAEQIRAQSPAAPIVELRDGERRGLVYDALSDPAFSTALLRAIAAKRTIESGGSALVTATTAVARGLRTLADQASPPTLSRAEQSNTSVIFGDQLIMKIFRRVESGLNPDLEIGRMLTASEFAHTSPVVGSIELRRGKAEPATLAIVQRFVPNQGDAWAYSVDTACSFFDEIQAHSGPPADEARPPSDLLGLMDVTIPPIAFELIGAYLERARLLGQRTAEMHLALASSEDPAFRPEPYTPFYLRAVYQSMRNQARTALGLLRKSLRNLPEDQRALAEELGEREADLLDRLKAITSAKIDATRIRHHGDYHLGQVLWTGQDFVIIDFEGEPARTLADRRLKRSALRDVAGMLRSFQYAAFTALDDQLTRGLGSPETLAIWADFWAGWVTAAFVQAYLAGVGEAGFLPTSPAMTATMLEAFALDKALYELQYELNNRPGWVYIPLRGIAQLLDRPV